MKKVAEENLTLKEKAIAFEAVAEENLNLQDRLSKSEKERARLIRHIHEFSRESYDTIAEQEKRIKALEGCIKNLREDQKGK
jgi:valyl-tRNA synthetase